MTQTRNRRQREQAETPEPPPGEPTPEEQEEEIEPPAPEPEPERDPAEVQARKIENAQRKYHKDLEGIVGDLSDAAWCDLCGGLGFTDPHASPRIHPEIEGCDKCGGLGQLVTGSRAPGHETLACDKCSGTGHVRKMAQIPTPEPQADVIALPAAAQQVHGWFDPVSQTFHPYAQEAGS